MKKQEGAADKEDRNETTPIHVVYAATMSELKIVDSIYFQLSFFFLFFFYFWELGLEFSVTSPVMVTQQCHSHTVPQSCVIIEEGRRFWKDDII